ncbi:hypothetical protein AALK14_08200 [Butyricimonas hominis]|uniref:hypothetical protein n=1 Tax=Butyricimonas hominis TaxID=2763032 RepID=UPI003512D175
MEDYNRLVIDLYKRCFTDYINGSPVDADAIQEVQRVLNFAIDKAKIGNEPTDTLEALKKDVGYLKYDLL